MKIINSVLVFMILVCGSQLSHGEKLNCGFGDMYFPLVGSLYSCKVTSLDNPSNNLIIEGYLGEHMTNKNDADVKAIWIHDTNTKYIPLNLGSLFNLIVLSMENTQLVEIKTKDFHGMQDLESISLSNNKLSSVPLDAFATLTKLRYISLSENQIEELPNGIFKNNLELEEIYLDHNRIKYLGTDIFNGLQKLDYVDLFGNICIKKSYYGATKINQLKDDIKMKCNNPNEVPAMTTTTTTTTQTPTTQNPMEVKLIEMQEKITNLEKELGEAKEQQQKSEAMTQDLTTKLSKCESMKNSFNISCEFQMTNGEYSCDARDLMIYQKQMELNEVSGTHFMSKTNENVTELKIANSSMLFWSNDIFKTFPGLQTLVIQNAQLKELSQGDFNSATNLKNLKVQGNVIRVLGDDLFQGAAEHLTNIQMNSNEIVKISTGTFHGLKQLKMLSLKDNLITELQLGTFKDVVMLEHLFLSGNKIKFLDGKLFEFNVKLMTLAVDHNELREIGEDILDYSVALEDVDFNGNDCIYQEFKGSEVDELKFNIKHCCKNPEQRLNVYNCGHRGWD